ncbi:MAG: hypothetical protein LEGION0398_MBIBDBAK_00329 [Legionellaceae bacterium]
MQGLSQMDVTRLMHDKATRYEREIKEEKLSPTYQLLMLQKHLWQ